MSDVFGRQRGLCHVVFVILVLAAGIAASMPVAAHHYAVASFDAAKPIHVTGVLTRFEWTNPHSHFYIDVKDDRGNLASWICEAGSPGDLARRGLRRGDVNVGDTLSVDGYRAKDGSRSMIVARLALPDGRSILGSIAARTPVKDR